MLTLPIVVANKLDSAAKRLRKIFILRGIAVAVAVFLLVTMVAMAADAYFVIFDDAVRYTISAVVWLISLAATFLAIWLPFRRPVSRRKAARVLDERHPENEERISTIVELVERSELGRYNTSEGLFWVLAREAVICANRVNVTKEFTARTIVRRLKWLAAVAAVLVASFAVFPGVTGLLFVRTAFPWVDVGNLYADYLKVTPGNIDVLKGETVEIKVEVLKKLPGEPMIRISRATEKGWGREFAERLPESGYRELADLSQPRWRYRVSCGPAVSKYYVVRVCEKPKYKSFTAKLEYPSYAGRKPTVYTNENVGALQAIEGTKVSFAVEVGEPGTTSELKINRGSRSEVSDSGTIGMTMVSNQVSTWTMELTSKEGFKSDKRTGLITSVRDQPPSVVIDAPKQTLTLPRHTMFPIEFTASDDIGLGDVEVRWAPDGEKYPYSFFHDGFGELQTTFHKGVEEIDLSRLDLMAYGSVRFDLVVYDRYPKSLGGPHSVTSTAVVIRFEDQAKSFEEQNLDWQMKDAFADMEEAARRLETAERLAREAQHEIERNPEKVEEHTEKKIEQLAHEVAEAEKRAEELAEKLEEDGKFSPIAEDLKRFAEEELAPVREKLEEAQFNEAEKRADALEMMRPMLEEAREMMKEGREELKERGEKLADYERTKDLAARQDALAASAKEIMEERPVDTKKLEAWKRMEEAAAKQAEDLSRRLTEPGIDEARRKMENAAELMKEFKQQLEFEGDKKLNDRQKKAKQAELDAAKAKSVEQEFDKALRAEKSAEDLLEKAVQNRMEAEKYTNNRGMQDRFNAQADNFEKSAAQRQREAEDALSRADATAEQIAAQRKAGELRREAAKDANNHLEGLKAALSAQRKAIRSLDDKAKEGEEPKDFGMHTPFTKTAAQKALEHLRAAEAAEKEALASLRRRDGEKAKAAAEKAASEQQAAMKEHHANAMDQAERHQSQAQAYAQQAAQRRDDGSYREAERRQKEALEKLRDAEDAIEEALGTDPLKLELRRRQEALEDRIDAAKAAAELASARAAEAEKRKDRGGMEREKHNAEIATDRAEGLERIAEKAREELGEDSGEGSGEGSGEPKAGEKPSEQGESQGEETAASEAREAADAIEAEVAAQARELGIRKPGERRGSDGEKSAAKGSGAAGNPEEKKGGAGSGVKKELEKMAKELKSELAEELPEVLKGKISKKAWFRIRGTVKEGLGERDLKNIPPEYRELVRKYFLKLAEEPAK